MKTALLVLATAALLACGKRSPREDLEASADAFHPDATEVPLSADFERAARRRVRPETYREELARIERELKIEARTR